MPGEGETVSLFDNAISFKVLGRDTDGRYGLIETVNAGNGPPPHIHKDESEAFYILEGEFDVLVGERTVRAPASAFVFVPKGMVHTFWPTGTGTNRMLLIYSPAGFEGFFKELGAKMPTAETFDKEVFEAISEKYGQTVVEMPPGHQHPI